LIPEASGFTVVRSRASEAPKSAWIPLVFLSQDSYGLSNLVLGHAGVRQMPPCVKKVVQGVGRQRTLLVAHELMRKTPAPKWFANLAQGAWGARAKLLLHSMTRRPIEPLPGGVLQIIRQIVPRFIPGP
jgi:hypothetical protein